MFFSENYFFLWAIFFINYIQLFVYALSRYVNVLRFLLQFFGHFHIWSTFYLRIFLIYIFFWFILIYFHYFMSFEGSCLLPRLPKLFRISVPSFHFKIYYFFCFLGVASFSKTFFSFLAFIFFWRGIGHEKWKLFRSNFFQASIPLHSSYPD